MSRKYKNNLMEALSLEVEFGNLRLPYTLPPPDYWHQPPVLGLWRFSTLGGPWAPPSTSSSPRSTR